MRCPICKRDVDDAEVRKEKSVYPFCGERCKLIDLGRWLSGRYQIRAIDEDGASREDGRRQGE